MKKIKKKPIIKKKPSKEIKPQPKKVVKKVAVKKIGLKDSSKKTPKKEDKKKIEKKVAGSNLLQKTGKQVISAFKKVEPKEKDGKVKLSNLKGALKKGIDDVVKKASKVVAPITSTPLKPKKGKTEVKPVLAPKELLSKAPPSVDQQVNLKSAVKTELKSESKVESKSEGIATKSEAKSTKKESGGNILEKEKPQEVVLTDAEGRRYCRVRECDQIAMVDAYCRFHYLNNWKKIQIRKRILLDGKLKSYLEELTQRYPDKYLEMIHRDLQTEQDFLAAIQELEIDDSSLDTEYEDEAQNYIQEVRGVSDNSQRDEEDF